MLSTPAAAREVFYAPDGVLAGMGVSPGEQRVYSILFVHRRRSRFSRQNIHPHQPGKGLVDCATLEVADMVRARGETKTNGKERVESRRFVALRNALCTHEQTEFDKAVKAKGGRFVEAPVSGSKVPAEQVKESKLLRSFIR